MMVSRRASARVGAMGGRGAQLSLNGLRAKMFGVVRVRTQWAKNRAACVVSLGSVRVCMGKSVGRW